MTVVAVLLVFTSPRHVFHGQVAKVALLAEHLLFYKLLDWGL